jgi:hypothetical protein
VLGKKFPAPILFLFMSFYTVSQPGFGVFRPTRTAVSAVFQAEGPGKCLKEVPESPEMPGSLGPVDIQILRG